MTPLELKVLSERLLDSETGDQGPVELAARAVCDKLQRPLVMLAGAAGFLALMSRAYAKALRLAPWLHNIKVGLDGCVEIESHDDIDLRSEEALAAQAVLVEKLLGLMCALVGSALTLSLIADAWPHMSLNGEPGENA